MKKLLTIMASAMLAIAAHAVTLNVTVPNGTGACFVAGSFNGWDAGGALQLTKTGDNTFTIDLPEVSSAKIAEGYKYLSGPDWAYVEKGASGEEISNRTAPSSMDVVKSWAKLYTFNENIVSTTIKVNGYDRKVEILLPDGYKESSEAYPVVYYVGVQQRYSQAGSDDAGDNLFGSQSWNLPAVLSAIPAATDAPRIYVATYSFVAENIPYPNADYMGSGASDAYLADFVTKVMGYVNTNYRTIADASSTTIMGADLGGVLSLYAAMTRPQVFGHCVSMSPTLWVAAGQMRALAAGKTAKDVILTYGTAEPSGFTAAIDDLHGVCGGTLLTATGGTHDEDTWAALIPAVYTTWTGGEVEPVAVAPRKATSRAADISSTTYRLYSAVDTQTLVEDNTAEFTYITDFVSGGAKVPAQVLVRDIPVSVKTKYYWNVARMPEGTYLKSSNGNIGFSSKKSTVSWHRVAILEDETVKDIAASSTGFTLQGADGKVAMKVTTGHKVKCSATFSTSDKSFTIHYGSVNSGSDMGALTSTYSVSATCTSAEVEYDFLTNGVTITETGAGDVIDALNFKTFQAVPAIVNPGDNTDIYIALDESDIYSVSLTSSLNYGAAVPVSLTSTGTNAWRASLSNLQAGIYHFTLTARRGSATKEVGTIAVKVVEPDGISEPKVLTVNAYKGVDWANINRYKANFHTHTSQSFDCSISTSETVDRYRSAGYSILALTDHDANPYPWTMFDLFNPAASARDPESMGMLAIPGVELSKDNRNTWNEATGGEFNHHNDFFTGRKGQEFASLRESYAYTNEIGGMQIINHPGQYWSLDRTYTPGEKNSPEWHAENFTMYPSLIGLEVYNQGNRRPNDRILWDQILDRTMPGRPVWGYSCDDTHNLEQYFRNYQFMLMPDLTVASLKEAMRGGCQYFSYEYTGSGKNLAPGINAITVDPSANIITIDTDAPEVYWIAGTDRSGGASTRKSTVVGIGKTFDYTGYRGTYVRALLRNDKGETCTQPFGFDYASASSVVAVGADVTVTLSPNPASDMVTVRGVDHVASVVVFSASGMKVLEGEETTFSVAHLPSGLYIVSVTTETGTYNTRLIINH